MKKSDKKKQEPEGEKIPHHGKDGSAIAGHGVYDMQTPHDFVNPQSRPGFHSGRAVPKPTPLGGNVLPQGVNGGGVGAGNDPEPAQPESRLVPQFLRGAGVPVYSAEAPATPDAN